MEEVESFKAGEVLGRLMGQRMAIDAALVLLGKSPTITIDELTKWFKLYDESVHSDMYALDASLDNLTGGE